jgi:hypothetical protein
VRQTFRFNPGDALRRSRSLFVNLSSEPCVTVSALFWIETVQYTLQIPIFAPGQGPIVVEPDGPRPFGRPVPRFNVDPPIPVPAPRTLTVTATQIQYTQTVNLIFKNLSWPHVSVARLVPADPVNIPASAWN